MQRFLSPMIKRTQVSWRFSAIRRKNASFTILFHAFSSAKDLQVAILTDTNGNENRNVLELAALATFQVNTIYVK